MDGASPGARLVAPQIEVRNETERAVERRHGTGDRTSRL